MEELQVILELIKASPFGSSMKALLMIFFVFFVPRLKNKEFRSWLASVFKGLFKHLTGNKIEAHYLFHDYRYYIHHSKHIKFECEDKTWAFQTLIDIKFKAIIFQLRAWLKANKNKYKKWDKIKFSEEFETLLTASRQRFEGQLRDKYILHFGEKKGREYYDIIMEGEQGFRAFHYRNFSIMDSFMKHIFIHESLSNTKLIYKFLGIIDTILSVTLDDLYVTFQSLNGRLCEKQTDDTDVLHERT